MKKNGLIAVLVCALVLVTGCSRSEDIENATTYSGANIHDLLTFDIPEGFFMNEDDFIEADEAQYSIYLSNSVVDQVYRIEIESYKGEGVAITDDSVIDMEYFLNADENSSLEDVILDETISVDGRLCNVVTELWPSELYGASKAGSIIKRFIIAIGLMEEPEPVPFKKAYIQYGDYIIGVGVCSFNAAFEIDNETLEKGLYEILNSIKFAD